MSSKSLTNLLLALFFPLSLWQLWEQDLFWLIRCGEAFLQGQWSCNEPWAIDAQFSNWLNIYWLSELIFYAVNQVSGVAGLVLFRGLLVLVFLSSCWLLLRIHAPKISEWYIVSFLPIIFISGSFQFEVDPEFLAASIYPWIYITHNFAHTKKSVGYISVLLSLLALNLHYGMGILFVVTSLILTLSKPQRTKHEWITGLTLIATLFGTPGQFQSLVYVFNSSADWFSQAYLQMTSSYFWRKASPWSVTSAIVYLALLLLFSFVYRKTLFHFKSLNKGYLLNILFLTVVTTLSANVFPYLLVATIPIAGQLLASHFRFQAQTTEKIVFVVSWLIVLPIFTLQWPHLYGLKIDNNYYPSLSIQFLNNLKPKGPVLHEASTGNYMHAFAKEYKVFIDTRERLFMHLRPQLIEANKSPKAMTQLINEFDFNLLLLPIHLGQIENGVLIDFQHEFFPPDIWKIVFFEKNYFVAIKNSQVNQEIIDRYEFKYLHPQRPAFSNFSRSDKNQKLRIGFEIDRCVGAQPDNLFCRASELFWLYYFDDSEGVTLKIQSLILKNRDLKDYLVKLIPAAKLLKDTTATSALNCWVYHHCY